MMTASSSVFVVMAASLNVVISYGIEALQLLQWIGSIDQSISSDIAQGQGGRLMMSPFHTIVHTIHSSPLIQPSSLGQIKLKLVSEWANRFKFHPVECRPNECDRNLWFILNY